MSTVADRLSDKSVAEPLIVADWESKDFLDPRVDSYIGHRLRAVAKDFRTSAIVTFSLGLTLGLLGWFFLGVFLDHWIFPNGLSTAARLGWFAVALAASVFAAVRWLLPPLQQRVNLVFAARTLERADPSLHNDIVNAVLVRHRAAASDPEVASGTTDRRGLGVQVVVRSVEKRAAKRLSKIPEDAVVDRSVAVRLAAAIAVLVGVASLYEAFSPKSLVSSFSRIAAPLSSIAVPTRVRIERVEFFHRPPVAVAGGEGTQDGDLVRLEPADRSNGGKEGSGERLVEVVRGRQLVIRASIAGLSSRDQATCEVEQLSDDVQPAGMDPWRVDLRRVDSRATQGVEGIDGGFTHEAILPEAMRGVDRPLRFVLGAGDARGDSWIVKPIDAPQILVREMRLTFPDYTRRAPETVEWQGDIRGVEGTVASMTVEANRPLQAAWIDLGADGQTDLRLDLDRKDPRVARGRFTLLLDQRRTRPWFDSYRLVFMPAGDGATLEKGLAHRIEVLQDLEPEVVVEKPERVDFTVAADLPTSITVRAVDPDFRLTKVVVEARLDERGPVTPIVLFEGAHQGPFRGTAKLVPSAFGAKEGDTVEYRATATDSRQLRDLGPNVTTTPWRKLRVADAVAGGDARRDKNTPESQSTSSNDRPDRGEAGPDKRPGTADEPSDPRTGDQSDSETRAGPPRESDAENQKSDSSRRPGMSSAGEASGTSKRSDQDASSDRGSSGDSDDAGARDGRQQGKESSRSDSAGSPREGGQRQVAPEQARENSDARRADGARRDGTSSDQGKPRDGAGGERSRNQDQGPSAAAGREPSASKSSRADKDRSGVADDGNQGQEKDASPRSSQRDEPLKTNGTDDGEAIERILEHRRRNEPQRTSNDAESRPSPNQRNQDRAQSQQQDGSRDPQQANRPQSGDETCQECQGKPGSCKNCSAGGAGGSGASAASGQKAGGEKAGGEKAGGEKAGGEKAGGEKAGGEKAGGEKAGGEKAGGEKAGGEKAGGEKAGGEKAGGEKAGGEKAGGEKAGGEKAGAKVPESSKNQSSQSGASAANEDASGQGGKEVSKAGSPPEGAQPSGSSEWVEPSNDHARNALDLAISHLRDSVASGDGEILDQLGWTRENAEAFLARWQELERQASSGDPRSQAELDRAIRSLGLTPGGLSRQSNKAGGPRGGQQEGRRSRPPAEYGEQFKAYSQGSLEQP